MIERRQSYSVRVGNVEMGSQHPICIQSMTSTDTENPVETAIQVAQLAKAGSEIVRLTVNTEAAARQVPDIWDRLQQMGVDVPLVGDFHYNGHVLLKKYPECAQVLAKYRINPGNVGTTLKRDEQFSMMIEAAIRYEKPVRIGVNWGSLDQAVLARLMDENSQSKAPLSSEAILREAILTSALESATMAENIGLAPQNIVLSCKVSAVQDLIALYRDLAQRCRYVLHLGLTEAGLGSKGIVASTAAMAVLLQEGIGDTIRVSLTPEVGEPRTKEVQVCQELLQTMGLRAFTPMVTSCPGCGRTSNDFFRHLAQEVQTFVKDKMPIWKLAYDGVEQMNLAVMGCIVNGPGESAMANIGISLPGNGEEPACPVFIDGKKAHTLRGDNITVRFKQIIEQYVQTKYQPKG